MGPLRAQCPERCLHQEDAPDARSAQGSSAGWLEGHQGDPPPQPTWTAMARGHGGGVSLHLVSIGTSRMREGAARRGGLASARSTATPPRAGTGTCAGVPCPQPGLSATPHLSPLQGWGAECMLQTDGAGEGDTERERETPGDRLRGQG